MGQYDENGNWVETFVSRAYQSESEALNKIKSVIEFYINESGWVLNGEPAVERTSDGYVAKIPFKKIAEIKKSSR